MATTKPRETRPRILTPEEGHALFDQEARALVGLSGEEFLRRWDAGEYGMIPDDNEHADLLYLAQLIPFGR